MSITDKIQRLEAAKTDIAGAITAKGGTVAQSDGFEEFSADINSIPQPSGKIIITENGSDIDIAQYASADVDVEQGIQIDEDYTVESGKLTSASVELDGDVVATIPDGVTEIGNTAFLENTLVTKIIIPNSVVSIENGHSTFELVGAFANCTNLKEIDLGNNLTNIGNYAFAYSSSLNSIVIPVRVTTIGLNAFTDSGLTDIYYTGTQAEWEQITGLSAAGIPQDCTIHYEYTPT